MLGVSLPLTGPPKCPFFVARVTGYATIHELSPFSSDGWNAFGMSEPLRA